MQWKTVEYVLKKLRKKLWINILLKNLINGIFITSILGLFMVLLSHIKSIVYVKEKIFYISIILLMFMIIKSILQKPSIEKVAKVGDKLGFKERLITYVELKEDNDLDGVFQIFKEDLEDELQNIDLIKKYKINLCYKKILYTLMIVIISCGSYFIPSLSREKALEMEDVNRNIKKEIVEIDKAKKDIIKDSKDENEKKEISQVFEKLKKALKNTYDYDKAMSQILKAEEKLNNINSMKSGKNLKAMASIFKGTSLENSELTTALQSENIDEKLFNNNIKISQSDKEKMLKSLNKNKDLLNDNNIKESLQNELMKKDTTTKDLVKSLKKEDKNFQLNSKLENTKDKLLSKNEQKGFENKEGNRKSEDFSLGVKENNYKYGENSNIKNTENTIGGNGNSKREDNNSIGSSKVSDNKEIREKANKGTIGKHDEATASKKSSIVSNVNSKINDSGKIFDKNVEDIIGEKGSIQSMENRWLDYKKEGMEYIFKYSIPLDKEDIVIQYFKALRK
ncbi:hypothetical protein BD780_000538 [Clostridium tetanomorphum]|uniref:Membrane-associated protein n=1 Tax=Clostridium tetanomorphum TaxID=1553 RepID=A0A923J0H8_CLOTT|nr:hypothetical protein [Clostridium tetanomorphum]KAJ48949.1 membrane-associated protein [Clostridium tetanomorphum DSM 665]KAJ49664.1 membrane-associated protein [Clostridium tetanomorphum DSM 665]MBC2397734.1 hypothetical protein [Clostridium tetanomorphum]MBP1865089.1 hypothetical protein [Clostridium tetanomorphum]NRS83313.1 hypothetical protein [Clostridium tetanomorphum]